MSAGTGRLLGGFATVGGWTMASRVLGFLRDVLIAGLLGAGPVAEAFFVAFRLPNMFRRFFAEGAFNAAFIPLFAKRLEGEGEAAAKSFAEEAMAALASALILFTLLALLAMPVMVMALASGFRGDPERFELAVLFGRICFPYILFISLAALFSGVLNSFGKFAAAAAAPVLLNVILCGVLAAAWALGLNRGVALSWAVLAAGMAQLALLVWAARKIGMGLALRRPRWTPGVARVVQLGIPAALAGGVVQINLLVGTQVASYTEGAVGWLWYADRVYQLPLGVVGVAIGVVLLPELSRLVRAGDDGAALGTLNRAGEFAMILTVPATVALLAIPETITAALFERGAFTIADSRATALALAVYAAGLPAFILQKILQPAYFAREDTRRPLRYAVVSMAINLVVAIGLMPVMGYLAAALGTVLAAWANFFLLWRGAGQIGAEFRLDDRMRRRGPRIVLAALAMGTVVLIATEAVATVGFGRSAFGLLGIVGLGMLAYIGFAAFFGGFVPREIAAMMRRRKAGG